MDLDYKKLITNYINNEIENLILYIHKLYPKIIKNNNVKKLLIKYCNNSNYLYRKYDEKKKEKIYFKVKQKIFLRKFKNKNISITAKERTTNFKYDKEKCRARTWGNGIIIKLENGKIIYGKQCCRKTHGKSPYCKLHSCNNPHRDFDKEPSIKLKKHYEQYQCINKKI
jgi:hypothetical protein